MSGKTIILNGQNHHLDFAGGAARYCSQLYNRLTEYSSMNQHTGYEIRFENFKKSSDLTSTGSALEKSTNDLFKQIIYKCCPPLIYDKLQRVYQRIRSLPTSDEITSSRLVTSVLPDLSGPTLLHELTNFSVINEIGRLSHNNNLILAVTFLDIQDSQYPEYFQDSELRSRRLLYSFYKDRADLFFAISNFTKQTMVEYLGIDPEKIIVTHLAADDLLQINPSENVDQWVKSLGRFWVYPAKFWKHKNHEFLIKAISKRKKEMIRGGVKLLLTGGFSQSDNYNLEVMIHKNSSADVVKILGFVTDEQLQALIRGADYLVFPSLYEGFGMPIIEAMALGCPVISSNTASLPEVGGKAALYFDPNCEEELLGLLDAMLTGKGIDRESLIRNGYENYKRFRWEKTFKQTFDAYQKVLC